MRPSDVSSSGNRGRDGGEDTTTGMTTSNSASTQSLLNIAEAFRRSYTGHSSTYEAGDLSPTVQEANVRQQNLLQWGCARACGCSRCCICRCFQWTSSNPNSQSGFSLRRLLVSYLVYTLFGSVVFRLINVEHWNWAQSIYYAMTVGLSIGYGTMSPQSVPCVVFAIVYVILGACALALLLSVFVRKLLLLVPRIAAEEWHYQVRLRESSLPSGLIPNSAKVAPRYWLPITLWVALFLWTMLGTIWAHEWQHLPEQKKWSWLHSLFFAVGTVTTAGMVGPQANKRAGQVPTHSAAFLAVYAFIGVPLFGAAVSHAAAKYVERQVRRQERAALRNRLSPDQLAAVRSLRRGTAAKWRCDAARRSSPARLAGVGPSDLPLPAADDEEPVRWGDYLALQLLRLHKVEFELIKDLRKQYLKAATQGEGGLTWSKLAPEVTNELHFEQVERGQGQA